MTKKIVHMTTLIGLLLLLLLFPSWTTNQGMDVYVMKGKLNWKASFTEPFEILYLLVIGEHDTPLIGLTTMEEDRINVSVAFIIEFLKADGYELSDVAIMIHNHFESPFLSWGNGIVLKKLRDKGFKGSFGVYHVPSDKIKWAKEE